jgi:hypothetical protein
MALSADVQTSLWNVVPLLLYGVLVPVVMVVAAHLVDPELRHVHEWASLQID